MRILIDTTREGFSHKTYCVYTHSLDGEIFYIGHGVPSRPFQLGGIINRNKAWLDIVTQSGHFDVDILGWYTNKEEARQEERRLIQKHQPAANFRMKAVEESNKAPHLTA